MVRFLNLILLLFIVGACSDFIEKDIEDDVLVLLGPSEGFNTEMQSLTFWWEDLKYATHYRLQIARPNFTTMEALELDTLITKTKLLYTLYPSDFEWRIRAENSGYQTAYIMRAFTVLTPIDILKQKVVLGLPSANIATGNKNVNFTWNKLDIAHNYTFKIKKNNWEGENVIDTILIDEQNLNMELEEGIYAWGVIATDTIKKESTLDVSRILYVDLTIPNVPVLTSPFNNASLIGFNQEFQWNYTEEKELTSVSFILQIANNKEMNPLIKEISLDEKFYSGTFTSGGVYYWRIKAVDEANNESAFSEINNFSLNNDQ